LNQHLRKIVVKVNKKTALYIYSSNVVKSSKTHQKLFQQLFQEISFVLSTCLMKVAVRFGEIKIADHLSLLFINHVIWKMRQSHC